MEETWIEINGFTDYLISNKGRIKSLKGNKSLIMKQRKDKDGYLLVNLCNNGKKKTLKVHRLVAESFIPNPENKPQINHKDFVKCNNDSTNLEWSTISDNIKHAYDNNLRDSAKEKVIKAHNKPVAQIDNNGNVIKKFPSIIEASRYLGRENGSAISKCCKGITRTALGFKWSYI